MNDIFMPWFTPQMAAFEGKIQVQFLASVYIQGTVPLTVSRLCCNSTSTGAGPDPSNFPVVRSMLELWSTLCAMVRPRAAHTTTLLTLEQKWSTFEAKMPHLALEGVES